MSDDLKPCPFCGGEPEWVDIPDDKFSNTGGSVIECMSCGASTHVEFGFKENLIDTWNRRAASRELVPATANRIEELETKLEKAMEALKEIATYKLSKPTRHFSGHHPADELDATVPASEAEYLISAASDALAELTGCRDE